MTLIASGLYCGCSTSHVVAQDSPDDALMLDTYIISLVEDTQNLSFALRLTETDSQNGRQLRSAISEMLAEKLADLARSLPTTQNSELVALACRAHERTTIDIAAATDSCRNTDLCDAAYDVALVCVDRGHATREAIAIPSPE